MKKIKEEKEDVALSRRKFFGRAGTLMAGAAITAAGCSALTSKKTGATDQDAVAWPLPYKPIDPMDARKRAYAGYYKGQ